MEKYNRYDIVECSLKDGNGSVQGKTRPVVIVSNNMNNEFAPILIVLPLTSVIKKEYLPVHARIKARRNGLSRNSMLIGEQPMTVSKEEIKRKIGNIRSQEDRNSVDRVILNAFFYGEKVDLSLCKMTS